MNPFQLLFGDLLQLLFDVGGRINRAKYWLTFPVYFGALFALYVLARIFAGLVGMPELAILILFIAFIPVVISCVAVSIKRLHDRNKSAWWLIVFYGLPVLLSSIGRYSGLDFVFQLAGLALSIWALVEIGILRGTSGTNIYGPDPLAVRAVGNARVRA